MPGVIADGNDVLAVQNAVKTACNRARHGKGPTLIECKTYRLSGHSRGDQRKYRSKEEEKMWWEKDSIKRFKQFLIDEQIMSKSDNLRVQHEVRQIITESVKFAKQSDNPDPATLLEGVFA